MHIGELDNLLEDFGLRNISRIECRHAQVIDYENVYKRVEWSFTMMMLQALHSILNVKWCPLL